MPELLIADLIGKGPGAAEPPSRTDQPRETSARRGDGPEKFREALRTAGSDEPAAIARERKDPASEADPREAGEREPRPKAEKPEKPEKPSGDESDQSAQNDGLVRETANGRAAEPEAAPQLSYIPPSFVEALLAQPVAVEAAPAAPPSGEGEDGVSERGWSQEALRRLLQILDAKGLKLAEEPVPSQEEVPPRQAVGSAAGAGRGAERPSTQDGLKALLRELFPREAEAPAMKGVSPAELPDGSRTEGNLSPMRTALELALSDLGLKQDGQGHPEKNLPPGLKWPVPDGPSSKPAEALNLAKPPSALSAAQPMEEGMRSEFPPRLEAADVRLFLQQIARSMNQSRLAAGQPIRIQVEPETLGALRIQVSVHEGGVKAEILVQNAFVRDLLEKNQDLLRETLAGYGMQIREFSVNIGHPGDQPERERQASGRKVAVPGLSLQPDELPSGLMSVPAAAFYGGRGHGWAAGGVSFYA